MDPVVAGGGHEERRRILPVAADQVIGRESPDELPLLRIIRVPVFRHPRRARQQLVITLHVQQRHFHHHRAEQLGILRQHVAHQQPTVAATLDAEVGRRGDAAPDQVLRHRGEVLIRPRPVCLERRLVPARAVLSSPSDIGHCVCPAPLEPCRADRSRVERRERDLEATVSVEQSRRRTVHRMVPGPHQEPRHPGAVLAGGEMLLYEVPAAVEERRHRLELLLLAGHLGQRERRRGEKISSVEPEQVALVAVYRANSHGTKRGKIGQRLPRPSIRRVKDEEPVPHVLQHVEHQKIAGPGVTR